MRRHIAVSLTAGVFAALTGIVSCAVRADGLTDQQIAFAARLVQQESGGNQRDRTGAVLVSSAGARGLFQLMPGTAARWHVNRDTAEGNVRGGLSEVIRLWDKYHGNQRHIAAAYNCGEQCTDDWLAGRRVLPAETQRYIDAVANSGSGSSPATNAPSSANDPALAPAHMTATEVRPPDPDAPPAWDVWAYQDYMEKKRAE